MTFIPELVSFQSGVVVHSHDKIELLSLSRSRARGFRVISDRHAPLAPGYTICDLRFAMIQREVRFQSYFAVICHMQLLAKSGDEEIRKFASLTII